MLITDIAGELTAVKTKKIDEKISRTDVTVDKNLSIKLMKAPGKYITVECDAVLSGDNTLYERLSKCICGAIRELCGDNRSILLVGVGNRLLTADALGPLVCDEVITVGAGGRQFARTLTPGVFGVTGVESFDVVRGVAAVLKPDVIFAIDSLCAARVGRLCSTFQLSDAGITPGSGVKNARAELSKRTLGADVISIGVPTVVFTSTIASEGGADISENDCADMVVTPKDIDIYVKDCAGIIADAINLYTGAK